MQKCNKQQRTTATPDDCIKKTKRKTNFAKIIVSGAAEKPYYEIMWFDYMDRQYNVGYGSYNLVFVFQWLSECFEIEDAPPVDAVEVVHGRWEIEWEYDRDCITGECDEWPVATCSICGHKEYGFAYDNGWDKPYNYCPNCGAKMDGGDGDG